MDAFAHIKGSIISEAVAVIKPIEGYSVNGVFRFLQESDGVRVTAILTGLTPNSKHGVHIHEFGDIRDQKLGKSAGSHYNPDKLPHGLPPSPHRHPGSFGNLVANKEGEAKFDFLDHTITVNGHKNPIIGRSVVVHKNEDTGAQPAGNAGPRIGVGVIGIAKEVNP
tara:strand:+ start:5078 stop:5575 length:498 start_codon:yes stop_codon:yes gene_type:complete